MDNMARVEQYVTSPPDPTEDQFTRTLARSTAQIPSSALLALAIGAMGLSLLGQLGGRGKWGNFVAQWVPTIIAMGVYNKLVKLEGHDQFDRGNMNEPLGDYACEFCDSKFNLRSDLENHRKHCSVRSPVS